MSIYCVTDSRKQQHHFNRICEHMYLNSVEECYIPSSKLGFGVKISGIFIVPDAYNYKEISQLFILNSFGKYNHILL